MLCPSFSANGRIRRGELPNFLPQLRNPHSFLILNSSFLLFFTSAIFRALMPPEAECLNQKVRSEPFDGDDMNRSKALI
jgi:hypothetical protein